MEEKHLIRNMWWEHWGEVIQGGLLEQLTFGLNLKQ